MHTHIYSQQARRPECVGAFLCSKNDNRAAREAGTLCRVGTAIPVREAAIRETLYSWRRRGPRWRRKSRAERRRRGERGYYQTIGLRVS